MQHRQDSVKLCELFAGIGAQAQALRNIGCNVDATVCKIDEAAYRSYCKIHGDTPNLGDITKVEHLPECDILTWSFPCQAISQAGAKKGLEELEREGKRYRRRELVRCREGVYGSYGELTSCLIYVKQDAYTNNLNGCQYCIEKRC